MEEYRNVKYFVVSTDNCLWSDVIMLLFLLEVVALEWQRVFLQSNIPYLLLNWKVLMFIQ